MNDDPFSLDSESSPPSASRSEEKPAAGRADQPESALRRGAAWAGVAVITVIALGLPLLFGLAFYLFLSEEIVINGGDPLREARVWTIREGRSVTGLAWSLAAPERPAGDNPDSATTCARVHVRYLKWDGGLRFEPDSEYCRCYQRRNGRWIGAPAECRLE